MFFGVLTNFVSSFIKKWDAHATVHYEQPSTYYNELFPSDKERYDKSYNVCMDLEHTGIRLAYLTQHWVDDVSKWPPVDYPSIYTYFIETPGGYTRERLKAFKSLEAYNYYQRLIITQVIFTST